jgi:hypothetical protein
MTVEELDKLKKDIERDLVFELEEELGEEFAKMDEELGEELVKLAEEKIKAKAKEKIKEKIEKIKTGLAEVSYELSSLIYEVKQSKEVVRWKIGKVHDCYFTLTELGVDKLNLESLEREVIQKIEVVTQLNEQGNKLDDIQRYLKFRGTLYKMLSDCYCDLDAEGDTDFDVVAQRVIKVRETLRTLIEVL